MEVAFTFLRRGAPACAARTLISVTNAQIAARLGEIAALMEFDGEPFFKIKAYERAQRSLEDAETPARELIAAHILTDLPGVGAAIAKKIDEIDRTGTCPYLDELRGKFPPTILELLSVPGVGAKTAVSLFKDLEVTGIADLRRVVDDGSIAKLPRLGAKGIENLRAALAQLQERTKRMRLGDAWPLAQSLVAALAESGLAKNVTVAGSARRMEPTVGDLDIICTSARGAAALEFFTKLPQVERIVGRGETKATVWASPGISVDCRVVPHKYLGNLLQHFTGNKAHNVLLREYAKARGLKVSEYGIEDVESGKVRAMKTEEEVYEALGMQYIPPELRVGLDEIERARARSLPELISLDDIRGDLHAHTTWSDGSRSIEEMARAAAERKRTYLSISDHSPGRAVAHGLDEKRLAEQMAAVKAARDSYGVHLLCSSEVDIRADGSLDWPDATLAKLDIVVASIHSAFSRTKEEQTERLLRAIRNPYVNIIGHPTGAQIEKRAGYEFDTDAVFRAAAETGTALEINSNPVRLDLNATLARRAKELGCTIAIDTDAHSIEWLDHMFYGVGTARKAGLTKADVLNARPLADVLEFVKRKRPK
jgi:DNA polymerase (family 10)